MSWDLEIKKQLGSCGEQVYIGHNVVFTNPREVHLGSRVRIDPFTLITTGLKTGNNIQICSHAVLGGGSKQSIILGDWTFIGYGSKLFTASEDYSGEYGAVNEFWGSNKIFRGNIEFKDYSGVASDTIVMPGVVLPKGVCIGAKSFVYTDKQLQPWGIYLGNPLKFHKARNRRTVIELSQDTNWLKNYE